LQIKLRKLDGSAFHAFSPASEGRAVCEAQVRPRGKSSTVRASKTTNTALLAQSQHAGWCSTVVDVKTSDWCSLYLIRQMETDNQYKAAVKEDERFSCLYAVPVK